MTQARTCANAVGSPSLPQLWLIVMLRMFAALAHSVVSTFQMRSNRQPRDWRTDRVDASLPRMKNDIQHQEATTAVPQDSPSALTVSSTQCVRPSNHEGALTNASSALAQSGGIPPHPSGGGATRSEHRSSQTGWGAALTFSASRQTVPPPGPRTRKRLRTSILPPLRGEDKVFARPNGSATTRSPPTRLPRDRTCAPIHRLAPGTRIRAHCLRITMRHP